MGHIGSTIVHVETVDSTNAFARQLLRENEVEEGLVIHAGYQTAGKGQGDHQWNSEPGMNLLLSVLLFPTFLPAEDQFRLNKAITLGVLDFLQDFTGDAVIKWPNDIRTNGKKIAGILIQHTVAGDRLTESIAGIGINVNQTSFPSSLPDAISLQQILGYSLDIPEALKRLCLSLDARYSLLRTGHAEALDTAYRDNLLDLFTERSFQSGDQIVTGAIQGVDDVGRLLVRHPGNKLVAYLHGEIQL